MKFPAPDVITASAGRRRRSTAMNSPRSRSPGSRPVLEVREVVGARGLGPGPASAARRARAPAGRRRAPAGRRRSRARARRRRRAPRGPDGRGRASAAASGRRGACSRAWSMSPRRPPTATRRSASSHPAGERRVEADRQVARVDGRVVVDVVLAAERGGDGQARWPRRRRARPPRPARSSRRSPTTTSGRSAPARSSLQAREVAAPAAAGACGARRAPRRRRRPPRRARPPAAPARPAPGGPRAARRTRARRARGSARPRRPGRPTSPRSRRPPGSRSPGRPRGRSISRANLADEEEQRRRVLGGRVDADEACVAPGPAGDEAHARAGRSASRRPRPCSRRRPPCRHDDQPDLGRVVERVERGEVALAGDAEDESTPCSSSWSTRIRPPRARHGSTGSSKKTVARCVFGLSASAGST